jgi:Helix-turn-helix.
MTESNAYTARTGTETFEAGSARRRRLLREEQFIVHASEKLVELLERESVTRVELARRLGKTKGFVSQILAGDKNLTLRTVADVCDALGFRAYLATSRDFVAQQSLITSHVRALPNPRVNISAEPQAGAEANGVAA